MQGLRALYQYQGRIAEWSRLVEEIVPEYCVDDGPATGRDDVYSVVMSYRIDLLRGYLRDLPKAAVMQEKKIAWDRERAAATLDLPSDAPLDADQQNRIHSLAASVFTLGQILLEQGSADCIPAFKEFNQYCQRISDDAGEANGHLNIGHAYKGVAGICDLDAAEAAYRLSLTLHYEDDTVGRSICFQQIGMVHHQRFKESRARSEPTEVLIRHIRVAESHYLQALDLCPVTAITTLAPVYNQLGNLHADNGDTEQACKHYEKGMQIYERVGDRHRGGQTRFNIAAMYLNSVLGQPASSTRKAVLRRSRSYAEAALLDFQHYQGHAAVDEANCQQLIDEIDQQLE